MQFLPDVVTAVIRTLDPSEPDQRKGCLRASTRALHELVKQYPMVSFHQESQRYAVGTLSSVIVIFDLRTATKVRTTAEALLVGAAAPLRPAHRARRSAC